MPAAGGSGALIDGTAQALTARRRIRKSGMSGVDVYLKIEVDLYDKVA